jgi:hypothetical protein
MIFGFAYLLIISQYYGDYITTRLKPSLYLSHLLNAGGKREFVVSPGVYLKSPQKRAQFKVSLKSNSYVCV